MKKYLRMLRKGDLIIILFLMVGSFFPLGIFTYQQAKAESSGEDCRCQRRREVVKEFTLNDDGQDGDVCLCGWPRTREYDCERRLRHLYGFRGLQRPIVCTHGRQIGSGGNDPLSAEPRFDRSEGKCRIRRQMKMPLISYPKNTSRKE